VEEGTINFVTEEGYGVLPRNLNYAIEGCLGDNCASRILRVTRNGTRMSRYVKEERSHRTHQSTIIFVLG
jgi:hypothetical protein